jgi:peptidoglycan/xylan/chitin deacetylase (PgdA/CDA1 family)
MRLCAVSVDLDEIPNYFAIHGLPAPTARAGSLVYDVAIDRLAEIARDAAIPLTLFAIGSDLVRPESAARLRAASDAGFEIANHTLDHRYDLVRLGKDEIRTQIAGGAEHIERATGQAPVGFRAPGYTITDEVFAVLAELGVTYDSSVFPCPFYWAPKTAKIALITARGRASSSIVDTPLVLTAPTRPYRVGRPYWRRSASAAREAGGDSGGIWEIPIQVTRRLRLPFIGTALTLGGVSGARWLARGCIGEPLVNLELHGMDVLDDTDGRGALASLRPHQVDVRIPAKDKISALRTAIETLRAAGYEFVTLQSAASVLGGKVHRA